MSFEASRNFYAVSDFRPEPRTRETPRQLNVLPGRLPLAFHTILRAARPESLSRAATRRGNVADDGARTRLTARLSTQTVRLEFQARVLPRPEYVAQKTPADARHTARVLLNIHV